MKRKLFVVSGILIITIVGVVILRSISRDKNAKGQQLKTVLVEKGDIIVKVTESGKVEPVTIVKVKSELAGEVKKLFVEEGDTVKTGEKLALVQREFSQARQVAQGRASLERAKLDLEDAERNLRRKRELYEKGFIAQKDVEDAEKSYKNSKIQYELAQKQLWLLLGGTESIKAQSLASKTLDNIIVRSPISGVVIDLNVEEGEMITSGTQAFGGGGTIIMIIADLSKMIVKTDINEVDVSKVRVGQPVNIGFDAIKGRVYQGVVKRISPAGTDKQNIVVYPVEVEILGSAPAQSQGPTVEKGPSREHLFAQLTEVQSAVIRQEIGTLRKQGASRAEIRNAMQKKLREFGMTSPESLPQPVAPVTQPGEVQQVDIRLIKPGMTADLDIVIRQAKNVLCVPKESILKRGDRTLVMLVKDGDLVPQPVVTGLEDDVKVEVRQGLKKGDRVGTSTSQHQPLQESKMFRRGGHPRPR